MRSGGIASIIVLLVEGEEVALKSSDRRTWTKDNLLMMPTDGNADVIIHTPAFSEVVEGVRAETISALEDSRPFLPD